MIFRYSPRFERASRKLAGRDRERLRRAISRFEEDPRQPSLGLKRIQGTERLWEARASDALRFTFEWIEGGILLRNVGAHDDTLKNP